MKNSLGIFLILIGLVAIFYQFFFQGKIPIPADTLVGSYYPWLDYKWGYAVGVPVKNPIISDVFSQFFLWKYLSLDIIKSGQFPFWNPFSSSGTPLLATYHSAVLLPFNILLFLPGYFGWGLFIWGQFLVASLGMYLLLGKWVHNILARVTASFVFSFSGLMTTWAEFGTGVWAASQLPWIFYFLENYLENSKGRYLILLSFSFIILILSGHAQLTFYSNILFAAYIIYLITKRGVKLSKIVPLLTFWILGIGASLIQLIPSFEFMSESIRRAESYSKQFDYGLSPIYSLIRLFAADFFGNPTTYNHWDKYIYHEYSSFLGTLTLPFILPVFIKRFRNEISTFFMWVFVLSIFLSLKTPITEWLYSQPIPLLTYSSASRILFLTSFSGAILLGLGISKLMDLDYVVWLRRFTLFNLSILLGILFGIYETIYYLKLGNGDNLYISNLEVSLRNSALPVLFFVLLLVATYLRKKSVLVLILIIFFFDMTRYFLKYNPFVSSDLIFPKTPIIEFLQKQDGIFRISRADAEILPPNTWIAYKLSSIEGYDPLSLESYGRYFNRVNEGPYSADVSRYIESKRVKNKFIDSLNTRYLLAVKRGEDGSIPGNFLNEQASSSGYKVVFTDRNSVILENLNAAGFAYFPNKIRIFQDEKGLEKELNNLNFDPTQEALVVGDIKSLDLTGDGKMGLVKFNYNNISMEVETTKESLLIISQTFDPGWEVFINNVPGPLYKVNGALQGLIVPQGESRIELVYWPKSFNLSLMLSLGSITILVLSCVYFYNRKQW